MKFADVLIFTIENHAAFFFFNFSIKPQNFLERKVSKHAFQLILGQNFRKSGIR